MKRSIPAAFARGMTVVELLVVGAILSLLVALTMPAVQSAREASRAVQCRNNLRQLCLAIQQYESSFHVFPPGMQVHPFRGLAPNSKSIGWTIVLMPYLDRQDLYSQFDFNLDAQIFHRRRFWSALVRGN